MLKRLLAVILTTALVCTVLAYISYTPVAERSPDTLYDSFSSILLFYVLYAFPIILVSGFLLDFIVGMIINRSSTTLAYVPTVLGYGLSGVLIASILLAFTTKDSFDLPMSFGIAGLTAMLYYSLSVVFNRMVRPTH